MGRMGVVRDISPYPPHGTEIRLIERFVSLRGRRVLEIGCGEGRHTFQYAPGAAQIVAIDPDRTSIHMALKECASRATANVAFRVGSAERLPTGGEPFDVALFPWSL